MNPTLNFFGKKRAHPGSNQGPADLQSAALPLSYTPEDAYRRKVGVRSGAEHGVPDDNGREVWVLVITASLV